MELVKLKIDQMYQDQVESHRRSMQAKYEKERRLFEEEKRRRMQDIQSSIDKLNIGHADKEKLRQEIDQLNHEQKELHAKIAEIEEELEAENKKKRQLERDINELSIQIATQKAVGGKDESQRIVWLREELAKKQVEIQNHQRQYKEMLENRFDHNHNQRTSPSKVAAPASENINMMKLEHEMKQIKELLQ